MAKVSGKSALLFVLIAGCSSATEPAASPPPGPPDITAVCGSARPGATPPAAASTRDGSGFAHWFAVGPLGLGADDLRTGQLSPSAWQCYGFDLDGLAVTSAPLADVDGSCKRVGGAPSSVLGDGAGGIDNNFGRWIVPLLGPFDPCLDGNSLADAGYSLLLRIDGDLSQDGANVGGTLYLGRTRPVLASTVETLKLPPGIDPVATFAGGYVSGGFWVSGVSTGALVELPLAVGFQLRPVDQPVQTCPAKHELRLPISSLRLAVGVDGNHGTIAGVLPSAALRASASTWLGAAGYCPGSSLSNIVLGIFGQSADLSSSASTLQDPTQTCDGVSLGLGFAMTPIPTPPTLDAQTPLATSACAE